MTERITENYLEAHITVEPSGSWEFFSQAQRLNNWRASKFDQDEVDEMHGKWFISFRGSEHFTPIALHAMINSLNDAGYIILRWKIERTLADSKFNSDHERLLSL